MAKAKANSLSLKAARGNGFGESVPNVGRKKSLKSNRDELVKAGSGGPAGRLVVVVDAPGPKSVSVVAQARLVMLIVNPTAKIPKQAFLNFMLPSLMKLPGFDWLERVPYRQTDGTL